MGISSETTNLVGWIIGVFLVGIISIITGILSLVKAGRLLPKELKSIDLVNKSKEVSIADQFDLLATRAAEKVLKLQDRLDKLEAEYDNINEKVDKQNALIQNQNEVIEEQNNKIKIQEEKIELLECELNNAQAYNNALIQQMKTSNLIPITKQSTQIKDCVDTKKDKK